MQKIIIIVSVLAMLLLREECHGQSGSNRYTAGINYTVGVPTFVPQGNVSKVAIDTGTMKWYEYAQVGGWRWSGDRVQDISGCAAPAYTPGKAQSRLVLNACTEAQNGHGPELYKYTGSAWLCLNCGGNYTAGDGIDITGTEITNTAPDQVVSITGAGINAVTGTYPNFTVTGTEVDGSTTNEIQTLSVAGSNLSISSGNTVTLPTPSSTLDGLTDVTITSPTNAQILQYNTATTQWVNATLSAIAGSGTANYIPKWSGIGTQSNSGLYDTGSAIGYGTTSPTALFDITQSPVLATFLANYWLKNNNTNWNGVSYKWSNSDETNQFGLNIGAFNSSGNRVIRFQTFGSPTAIQWDFNADDRLNMVYRTVFNRGITGTFHSDLELRIGSHTNGGASKGVRFTYPGGGFGVYGTLMSVLETGNVLIGTTTETGAKLDVTSTTSGVLFPRMTGTQRDAIASPPDGLVVYNTTAAKLQVRAASAWVDLH